MCKRMLLIFAGVMPLWLVASHAPGEGDSSGYSLVPVPGGDGAFEAVRLDGVTTWRSLKDSRGAYRPYLYFRVPEAAPGFTGSAYVEVRYKDLGTGRLSLQYNARNPRDDYRQAGRGYGRLLTGSGADRTAVFELTDPDFRHAQNLGADLRLCGPGGETPLRVVAATLYTRPTDLFLEHASRPWLRPYEGPRRSDVDATTLHGKVLCGYQGWFRCPGDGTEEGWVHWSRDRGRITPETLTFDLWPDMLEYSEGEKYPAPGFKYGDGRQAHLFSSANRRTVERHFDWMQAYGIDGVLVQRFVVGLHDPAEAARVLGYARGAANRTGRTFAVEYDLSGTPPEQLHDRVVADWKWLVDEMKITQDPRYLHHDGAPVLAIFGFYSDRFAARLAHRLIDFFKDDPKYRVTLIGGCQWWWRKEADPEWARAFRRFDAIKPWDVGNVSIREGVKHAPTGRWAGDLDEARRAGMLLMPVIYPGFSWDNLRRRPPGSTAIGRRGGAFFREQFEAAAGLGIDAAFVAMFDEVDEATAIFKVTDEPPAPGHFATIEGRQSDWYLRLTGAGTKLLRGDRDGIDRMDRPRAAVGPGDGRP